MKWICGSHVASPEEPVADVWHRAMRPAGFAQDHAPETPRDRCADTPALRWDEGNCSVASANPLHDHRLGFHLDDYGSKPYRNSSIVDTADADIN